MGVRPGRWSGRDHARPHPRLRRRPQPTRPRPSPRRHPCVAEVALADDNQASVGDVIITPARTTASSGFRPPTGSRTATVGPSPPSTAAVGSPSGTTPAGTPSGSPPITCTTSTGLGYATTIHAAQGVSADTMHSVLTGQESRQQLYTMLTRGRHANHLYLQVVGDGDPHSLIRPEAVSPRTPAETLHQILARDETPVSATACSASSTIQHPACTRRCSATPTASTSPPNNLSNPERWPNLTASTSTSPASPRTRLAYAAGSPDALGGRTGSIRSATCRSSPEDAISLPPKTWRPSSTGGSPSSFAYQPRSPALAARHSTNPPWPSALGAIPDQAMPTRHPPRRQIEDRAYQ